MCRALLGLCGRTAACKVNNSLRNSLFSIIIPLPSKLIHHCTRLGFLEHQGQDERLVAPVASGAGVGLASEHQQLCLKPCCHDLNTRFSLNKVYHQHTKQLNRLFGCVTSSCWGRSLLADAPCPSCLPGYTRQAQVGSLKSLILAHKCKTVLQDRAELICYYHLGRKN